MPSQFVNPLQSGSVLHGQSYNYIIEKPLGQGSFGITYLAKVQMQGALGKLNSNMRVAVKEFFMREVNGRSGGAVTIGSDSRLYVNYKKKFRAEAMHLAKLEHPHIVDVLENFEENNTAYYVMEYIEGGSLDDYIIKEGRLSEAITRDYIRQIGEALHFMHDNKMMHFDLKPANIMRRKDGTLVLIDFGLSKQFDAKGEPESSTTIGGGTPGYAPIEQANYHRGEGLPVTMDVYALGATAYRMLLGAHPPKADEILNYGFPYADFQALSISPKLIDVIAKAMMPMVVKRIQTVGAMLAELGFEGYEKPIVIDHPKTPVTPKPTEPIDRGPKATELLSPSKSPKPGNSLKYILIAIACMCVGAGIYGLTKCSGKETDEPIQTIADINIKGNDDIEKAKGQQVTDYPITAADGTTVLYKWTGELTAQNQPTGEGVAVYVATDKQGRKEYHGAMNNGLCESSNATLLYTNGSKFEGSFKDGMRAEGTMTITADEMYYKGTYKNDKEYNGKWFFLGSDELYSEVVNGVEKVK